MKRRRVRDREKRGRQGRPTRVGRRKGHEVAGKQAGMREKEGSRKRR